MERLLVTGVDRSLGLHLALELADHLDVLGLYSGHVVESPCFRTTDWRPHDRLQIGELLREWRPHWILHCGPLSGSNWDPPAPSDVAEGESEPLVVARLAEVAAESGARLTVISSDAVFAGPRMFHEESSTPTSPAPRAAQVRAMEQALAVTRALVVRTHAYGWSPVAAQPGFAQHALESLAAGTLPAVDGLRHATPILASDLAEPLLRAYQLRLHGLYHLAGAERASTFRFVSELAAAFGLHIPRPGPKLTDATPAVWHDETSLNSKRARRLLEMAGPMLGEGLLRFAEQQRSGWRDRYQAAGPVSSRHEIAA